MKEREIGFPSIWTHGDKSMRPKFKAEGFIHY